MTQLIQMVTSNPIPTLIVAKAQVANVGCECQLAVPKDFQKRVRPLFGSSIQATRETNVNQAGRLHSTPIVLGLTPRIIGALHLQSPQLAPLFPAKTDTARLEAAA
jgi:hypothetical protein